MNKKILVPLDGSILAEEALDYAKWLAEKVVGEILLVHVEKTTDDGLRHMRWVYLEAIAKRIHQEMTQWGRQVRVEAIVISGDPAEQILKTADTHNVDLITIGTHGRSGFKRWALGSVCDRVIRAGNFPTLMIRPKNNSSSDVIPDMPKTLLITLDGSPQSEVVLRVAQSIATEMNLEVIVLRVVPVGEYKIAGEKDQVQRIELLQPGEKPPEGYLNSVVYDLGEHGITARSVLLFGRPEDEIITFVEKNDVDMIAMATHGRGSVSRWAMGSVANKIMQEVNIPLLTVKSKAI